jgi:hypothetical protein
VKVPPLELKPLFPRLHQTLQELKELGLVNQMVRAWGFILLTDLGHQGTHGQWKVPVQEETVSAKIIPIMVDTQQMVHLCQQYQVQKS